MNRNNETLDDFTGWEDATMEDDFFKELEKAENPEIDIAAEEISKGEEESSDQEDTREDEELPKEEDLFEDEDGDESIFEDEETDEDDFSKDYSLSALKYLQDKGLIDHIEDFDPKSVNEDFVEDKFEEAIENRVKELFSELPEIVKQLNSFVLKGGDARNFLEQLSYEYSTGIQDDLDIEDEEVQEMVMRESLRGEGRDSEYIEAHIEFLRDTKRLGPIAKKEMERILQQQESQRLEALKIQEERKRRAQEALRESKRNLESYLKENEAIGTMSIPKKDIRTLPSYISDRTVKLQNGAKISQLQKELYYDLPQNEQAYLQLATLMKNRNEDGTFNFDFIIDKENTKFVRNMKKNLRRTNTDLPKGGRSSSQRPQRKLADFFN